MTMNKCLKVLEDLPAAAAKRALTHKKLYHGEEWAKDGVS